MPKTPKNLPFKPQGLKKLGSPLGKWAKIPYNHKSPGGPIIHGTGFGVEVGNRFHPLSNHVPSATVASGGDTPGGTPPQGYTSHVGVSHSCQGDQIPGGVPPQGRNLSISASVPAKTDTLVGGGRAPGGGSPHKNSKMSQKASTRKSVHVACQGGTGGGGHHHSVKTKSQSCVFYPKVRPRCQHVTSLCRRQCRR
jgi:hypothetical protein